MSLHTADLTLGTGVAFYTPQFKHALCWEICYNAINYVILWVTVHSQNRKPALAVKSELELNLRLPAEREEWSKFRYVLHNTIKSINSRNM